FSGVMMVLSRSWLRCSWASRTASTRAAPGSATASRAVAVAAASARQATAAMARRGRQGRARRLTFDASDDVEIHVLVDRHRLERVLVQRDPQDRVLLLRREAPGEVGAELGLQQRNAFLAPALVPDGVFAHDLVELPAVRELDRQRVGDRALLRVVVVRGELLVLDAGDLVAQPVDARVRRHVVLVVLGGE